MLIDSNHARFVEAFYSACLRYAGRDFERSVGENILTCRVSLYTGCSGHIGERVTNNVY